MAMGITPETLLAECQRALAAWPFLFDVETAHQLPRGLLLAVGSRETNLNNEVGDGGHGHGVFQLDDRSHHIPAGFDSDVGAQADKAAAMLSANIASFQGDLHCGVSAYNCGAGNVSRGVSRFRNPDHWTAGPDWPNYPGNYGGDVLARLAFIQEKFALTPPPDEEDDVPVVTRCTDPTLHPEILVTGVLDVPLWLSAEDDVRAYSEIGKVVRLTPATFTALLGRAVRK
jgi:hypothetical protein